LTTPDAAGNAREDAHPAERVNTAIMALIAPVAARDDLVRMPARGKTVLNAGILAVGAALVLTVVSVTNATTQSMPAWPLVVALAAVALGIPHGAVDHLTIGHRLGGREWTLLSVSYLSLAAMATALILIAPALTFGIVLAMTVWHFGSGDVAASAALAGTAREQGFVGVLHAVAAGSAPVLLPLTSTAAVATLAQIQPQLSEVFTPVVTFTLRFGTLALVAVMICVLLNRGKNRGALELGVLGLLGLVAAPFVAFAVYFGLWHALRHTARLAQTSDGQVRVPAIARVFIAGLPALAGAVLTVAVLMWALGAGVLSADVASAGAWLWFGLALVWGLTVPHMMLVSRYDRRKERETLLEH
jgi:Brp/Blh family beta-carotene 15,15'-monooxygenase